MRTIDLGDSRSQDSVGHLVESRIRRITYFAVPIQGSIAVLSMDLVVLQGEGSSTWETGARSEVGSDSSDVIIVAVGSGARSPLEAHLLDGQSDISHAKHDGSTFDALRGQ